MVASPSRAAPSRSPRHPAHPSRRADAVYADLPRTHHRSFAHSQRRRRRHMGVDQEPRCRPSTQAPRM